MLKTRVGREKVSMIGLQMSFKIGLKKLFVEYSKEIRCIIGQSVY